MFSIFQKKNYLVDLLAGMTDFHNHILPGIDDGAKNIEDSLTLIEKFNDLGITDFVATPHVMGDYYPNTPTTINSALQKIKVEKPNLNINAAAEYMMDQNFIELIVNRDILPIHGNNILVEMSYFQAPINLNEILFKLQNNSYSPILAHPERYPYFHTSDLEKFKDLKSRGCSFQLNMLSLTGHYGSGIQKIAFKLLDSDLIDFISSDVHRLDHLQKIETITISKKFVPGIQSVINQSKNIFN
ncbi:histidinol phosphatase [Christiangramia salexigens]|uniref:protein-tyrosine-phosphatase n=2 Tax=Christiangramia salexigens TaxID=1913577 RepID=A0A1L3J2E6_9FLAO|nr:histidinol phosphatase [Christiangramia salexigens]